ncbi:helix-turn-helix domain-containing protein [Agrobacterium vitis]|uniref:helix-turn-helix domain-containing protein n=1 Tax=Agrobacterium vitis TaxID=373 RepID=UPI00403E7DE0
MAPKPKTQRKREPHYIREWRTAKNLTQIEAAEAIGVDQSTISKIERGVSPYDQDFLEIAAGIYGCQAVDLICRAPDDKKNIRWNLCHLTGKLNPDQLKQVRSLVISMVGVD